MGARMGAWEKWVEEAIVKLESLKVLNNLSPICYEGQRDDESQFELFHEMRQSDRSSVEVTVSEETVRRWLHSAGEDILSRDPVADAKAEGQLKKLVLFSGSDYLGLASHPAIVNAAAVAAREYGMGPRSSPTSCGYTTYHRLLESSLAELMKKEECLVCPTGFAANNALFVAIGSVASLSVPSGRLSREEKVAIFSDALNHASIIDGLRVAERQGSIEVFVYEHNDMVHLNTLLTSCPMKKKAVVTDSLFSMDGHYAPMPELVKLRKKHGFLLVIDDAHATLVAGKNGGGVAEEFDCEEDVDIITGTLSKAVPCIGGFIACSKKWKLLIQSRGRSFIFSCSIPVPMAAAAYAATVVARKETWRRKAIWDRVEEFSALSGITFQSPIISIVVGSEENALQASWHLLQAGFHVTAIRPPVVPPNTCRLRVSLSAAHTSDDMKNLVNAISSYVSFGDIIKNHSKLYAKL